MHQSEWLDQAKAVPVGQKRRVKHGAEATAAMDVYNNEDSWSAYCHRCHESSKVHKQFLQKVDTSVPVLRKYLDYSALVSLQELAATHPEKYKAMVVLLHTKHVSTTILKPYKPMYCLTDDRLVFRFKGVDIGRDCTGRSSMKWFKYHTPEQRGFVYLQGKDVPTTGEVIAACEDLFSSMKITHYTGLSTMCLLGTRFEDEKVTFVISRNARLLGAQDGDAGGDDCSRLMYHRCSSLGIPYKRLQVPAGLDPKDMLPVDLIKLIEEAKHEISKL